MTAFNFNLPKREPTKESKISRAQATIIFRAVSGLGLRDSHDIVCLNFHDFNISTTAFASMLEAWLRTQK